MMNGERVKALRTQRGWSVQQLAIQAGLSRDGVHKIESGNRAGASAASAAALATALDTTADFLLDLTDAPRRPEVVGPVVPPDLLPLVDRLAAMPLEQRARFSIIAKLILDLTSGAPDARPR